MNYEELYRECNHHLVESDKKRDQIIAFFTTIVGAFVVLTDSESQMSVYFLLILVLLGFVLAAILVQFRKWHIRYVNSGRILANLLADRESKSKQSVQRMKTMTFDDLGLQEQGSLPTKRWLCRYFQGVEVLTYQAFLLVAFVPLHFSIQYSQVAITTNAPLIVPFAINLILYLFLMNAYAIIYLAYEFGAHSPFALWVLPREIVATIKETSDSPENENSQSRAA